MLGKSILYVKEDAVAWVTLNRPQAQNRLDLRMCNEIRDVCQAIAQDDEVRLAVITGAGDTFCGGDEEEPSTLSDGDSAERIRERLEPRRVAAFIGAIEKPIIAGINGDALGHGLEIALACDIRVAAAGANFGMTQICDGTIPWDGGTQRLPRIVGLAWATDMLLSGRVMDSEEALRIGLGAPDAAVRRPGRPAPADGLHYGGAGSNSDQVRQRDGPEGDGHDAGAGDAPGDGPEPHTPDHAGQGGGCRFLSGAEGADLHG